MPYDDDELAELDAVRDEEASAPRFADFVLLCKCHCVEEHELQVLVDAGADLAEIARKTGATTGCSACRPAIEAMIAARSTR